MNRSWVLGRNFYHREPTTVARALIGKYLVRILPGNNSLRGKIVEVEAYGGSDDPASHAFRGLTERNRVMFGKAGVAYIYFTYGFHYCLNVVTGKVGVASAVLIRAVEPTDGIEFMRKNRNNPPRDTELTSGPGKVCQAFALDKRFNGLDLTSRASALRIEDNRNLVASTVSAGQRIGLKVGVERNWRYFDPNSKFVSHRIRRTGP